MMAMVFAILAAGLAVGWFGSRRLAIILVAVALVGAAGLFLWEIYSPEYGFRMPWIDT
jgi:hypothetical protein